MNTRRRRLPVWEKLFLKFSYEIRALAQKYPADVGNTRVDSPLDVR